MPTNLAIDDKLLEKAVKAGGHRTKRATVNEALEKYVQRRKRLKALRAFRTVDFNPRRADKRTGRRR